MKKLIFLLLVLPFSFGAAHPTKDVLIYHEIQVDDSGGILPWYSPEDLGKSYDHTINLVWSFWDNMRTDINGLPYYMNHLVWRPDFNDPRGLGGDQIQMALSSWQLYYAYSGNERVKQNMKFMLEYYLTHGLSSKESKWPNLPYPYNTMIYSGIYDGDLISGVGYLQTDKAGSLGLELVHMYKMTISDGYHWSTSLRYLDAAKNIAKTLIAHLRKGDDKHSPLPYRVNAMTGKVAEIRDYDGRVIGASEYTSNWVSTMMMLTELAEIDKENSATYLRAYRVFLNWLKNYPLKNNNWGPFFEDVGGWSNTQINAITFARFMMLNQNEFPNWKTEVPKIFDWAYQTLGNNDWQKYGVTVVNEQTVCLKPGESHVARQGSTEIMYSQLSGDTSRLKNAIRELSWATYTVDNDGKNKFPQDENWLTDGYGDYVRHYLRAMAAMPELAPADSDHILSSTSIVQQADYQGSINKFLDPYVHVNDINKVRIYYRTYDPDGVEVIRMRSKPKTVRVGDAIAAETINLSTVDMGYNWAPMKSGGVLTVKRKGNGLVIVSDE